MLRIDKYVAFNHRYMACILTHVCNCQMNVKMQSNQGQIPECLKVFPVKGK